MQRTASAAEGRVSSRHSWNAATNSKHEALHPSEWHPASHLTRLQYGQQPGGVVRVVQVAALYPGRGRAGQQGRRKGHGRWAGQGAGRANNKMQGLQGSQHGGGAGCIALRVLRVAGQGGRVTACISCRPRPAPHRPAIRAPTHAHLCRPARCPGCSRPARRGRGKKGWRGQLQL